MTSINLSFFRGLLLPKIIVDDFGGTRTDAGMLGNGVYFASSARYVEVKLTQIKFCKTKWTFVI